MAQCDNGKSRLDTAIRIMNQYPSNATNLDNCRMNIIMILEDREWKLEQQAVEKALVCSCGGKQVAVVCSKCDDARRNKAVEKAIKDAEASLVHRRAEIMKEGASIAMGELRVIVDYHRGSFNGAEEILKEIDARYPTRPSADGLSPTCGLSKLSASKADDAKED